MTAKAPSGKSWRILVVDDQAQARSALQRTLSFEGFAVTAVASGERALDMLATAVFDLVLLDVNLPDLDGFSVLEKMRETPGLTTLPVIMVTGNVDSQSVLRGKKLQVCDYLLKPYRIADLLTRVERCLARSALPPPVDVPPGNNDCAPADQTLDGEIADDQR